MTAATASLTLRPTGDTGTMYVETGDRATSGPRTWTRYEVVEVVDVQLHDAAARPQFVDVTDDGDAWVFFIRRTRRGADFKSGHGIHETLSGLERAGRLPELAAAIRAALAPAPSAEAEALAARFPIGAQVRNTRTGRRAWVVGTEYSPRDGVEVVQIDYRDGSPPAASSAEFTELVDADQVAARQYLVSRVAELNARAARYTQEGIDPSAVLGQIPGYEIAIARIDAEQRDAAPACDICGAAAGQDCAPYCYATLGQS
jgi:hypothetical protein